MEIIFTILIACVIFAVLGTWGRIAAQWNRDGILPGGKPWELTLYVETFIGVICGLLIWLISLMAGTPETWVQPMTYVGSLSLGYAGTDALEALLAKYLPKPDEGG